MHMAFFTHSTSRPGSDNSGISTGCRTSTPQHSGSLIPQSSTPGAHTFPPPRETPIHSKCLQFLHDHYLWGLSDRGVSTPRAGLVEGKVAFPSLCGMCDGGTVGLREDWDTATRRPSQHGSYSSLLALASQTTAYPAPPATSKTTQEQC